MESGNAMERRLDYTVNINKTERNLTMATLLFDEFKNPNGGETNRYQDVQLKKGNVYPLQIDRTVAARHDKKMFHCQNDRYQTDTDAIDYAKGFVEKGQNTPKNHCHNMTACRKSEGGRDSVSARYAVQTLLLVNISILGGINQIEASRPKEHCQTEQ